MPICRLRVRVADAISIGCLMIVYSACGRGGVARRRAALDWRAEILRLEPAADTASRCWRRD